ncbi:hypothetical protein SKAU_G00311810 [Synaphobranchus kaupii]|uniref:Uncharacterized protein n=1 Tax=Synaphobranchus kaupii TaxID=118154 RepID=A0A9Q1ERY6_SYNKA|nr:hypothetical protein SKAU_G00311810 [Synaphobranchus kaupii]
MSQIRRPGKTEALLKEPRRRFGRPSTASAVHPSGEFTSTAFLEIGSCARVGAIDRRGHCRRRIPFLWMKGQHHGGREQSRVAVATVKDGGGASGPASGAPVAAVGIKSARLCEG